MDKLARERWRSFQYFLKFIKEKKKWWLGPLILLLILLGLLLTVTETSPLAPLIYTLF